MDPELGAESADPPILEDTSAKQANVPVGRDEAVATPESEDTDVKLPALKQDEEADGERKAIRIEIPDSEEISECSSPVKVDRQEGEKGDAVSQGDARLQPVEEEQENEAGQVTVNGERKMTSLEIPNSEEASEVSSPVKVDMGLGKTRDEAMQLDGRQESIGDKREEDAEGEDATMMDLSALAKGDGMLDVEGSRAGGGTEVEEVETSEAGQLDQAIAVKKIEYTLYKDDGHVQGALLEEMEAGTSVDMTLNADDGKIDEQGASSTGVAHNATVLQANSDKGEDVGGVQSSARTDAQVHVNSSPVNVEKIAIAAQKLLEEISPTLFDVTDTVTKPRALKTITLSAIPDSDDDEDEDLPDALVLHEGIQNPTPRAAPDTEEQTTVVASPTFNNDRVSNMVGVQYSDSVLAVAETGHEIEQVTTSFKKASPDPEALISEDATASRPELANNRRLREDTTPSSTLTKQFAHGAEINVATDPLPSPNKLETSSLTSEKKSAQPNTTRGSSQQNEETSQTIEIPSSPPQLASESFFQAKRDQTPSASFHAPEGSQNKDVLMAELKAMKIASIQTRISALEAEIASKRAKLEEVTKELTQPAAETVKRHIKLLHDYNDIKDVGQGLVGMIADNRGVRIGELYQEFGVDLKD